MKISRLRAKWEALGRTDPFWAMLNDPEKKGGRWELKEFLRKGQQEVARVMSEVRGLGLEPGRGRALDSGFGVGRLTQALCGVGSIMSPNGISSATLVGLDH